MRRGDVARSALDCGARNEAPLSSERWAIEKPEDFVRSKRCGLRESGDIRRRAGSDESETSFVVPQSNPIRKTLFDDLRNLMEGICHKKNVI